MEDSFLPCAFVNLFTVKSNRFTRGCGPLALPPNVCNLSPAGRILLTLIFGILQVYRNDTKSLKALAHPSLESVTAITSSVCSKGLSGIVGSLPTCCLSTEKPTPVPFISIYRISSKERGLSTGIYEQLYPATFSRSNAGPAVINALIEGITEVVRMASSSLARVSSSS